MRWHAPEAGFSSPAGLTFTAIPTFWCMSRQDRLPKLRYRAIRYPNGRYLPPVYDPPRIRVRGDHGHDSWISIEEGDIVARFKTFAEAHIAAEQMTAEVRGHGPASGEMTGGVTRIWY